MAETTTASHTEAPSEHQGGFPPFQSETFAPQLVWLILTFVILYVAMAKAALPRVGAILEARRNRIAGDLAEAERLKGRSDAALAAYEKALADARTRAQAIAAETRQQQLAESEQIRKSIERKLDEKLAEAERTINATKTSAMTNVRGIAVDAASAIVERLIGAPPPAQMLAAAVEDVLKR
jgi:F-type H+-transporting ATPase subunit b